MSWSARLAAAIGGPALCWAACGGTVVKANAAGVGGAAGGTDGSACDLCGPVMTCETSQDCCSGAICEDGYCFFTTEADFCCTDADCLGGEKCFNEACGACASDAQCGAGQKCDNSVGFCVGGPCFAGGCSEGGAGGMGGASKQKGAGGV